MRLKSGLVVCITLLNLLVGHSPSAQALDVVFSQRISSGVADSSVIASWESFRASLTGNYNSFTWRSTTGGLITVSDPTKIQTLANALRTGSPTSTTIGSNTWLVGTGCGSTPGYSVAVEFSNFRSCSCESSYSLRPLIGNQNWGGVGTTCGAVTQTITLTFFAVNVDTTAPTITGPSGATGATSSISIPETATAVHTFTANESVTWSKSGTDGSFFTISSGGALTITARNFESPADSGGDNTYVVVITATDGAANATNQTLTVTITNVNEAPTITINSSASTHTFTQAENISTVATYTATDVDAGATLSFSLSGTDAADFSIDSSSGALAFAANPDFEAPADSDTNNSYIIIVTVSDGSLTDTQTVTITITNANESASINAPTVSGTINKGVATTITVTINVAGKVRFFVGGKRISTCKDRTTSGTYPNNSATCSWRPAVTGRQILTATLTPTDNTFSASTSAATTVQVVRRSTSR